MPYKTQRGRMEKSRSIGHVPVIENELVQARLLKYHIHSPAQVAEVPSTLLRSAGTLGAPALETVWAMSFDGSPQEVAPRKAFPSTRVGFIQVAGVLVNLQEMLGESEHHLVDPAVIHAAAEESLYSMVLPGSNICRPDMSTVRDSWRKEIFENFSTYKIEELPLLDLFLILVGMSDKRAPNRSVVLSRCSASESCQARDIIVPSLGTICSECGGELFPTDALRIHEEVLEEHANVTSLGRLLSVLEQLTLVGYLQYLLDRRPQVLGSVAFLMDGPLAIFGPQAWLHTAMQTFIFALQERLRQRSLASPVILGIEKSGQFADHAQAIEQCLDLRTLMLLPDNYIFDHILTFRPTPSSSFGRDTYYGQKFFYKTAQGQMLTITVPKQPGALQDCHLPDHYPALPDTLALLDRIGTTLYEDAVIPIALAHSFASIPLRTGSRVLTLMSQRLLGLTQQ